ncbi:type II secretion system protein D [Campylobacter blaseri]|uniref:ABC transporter ATP-binding protein n=1 Tax=Campylobacter blaseri TaxID=2042961 RepID=A0A2P8R2J5_9BACT|nr:ABC transporter ATP-binding protein [Campylobacter blaseri]PSM52720.1 ABC transporter ATP-binding protein [Campylobacter blaseri]PSM54368.1 ABC transporter ATP-binding protein [Campylobacter blaseri]QKF86024.1 type II secretion system protein D [Campylobacter blaseri]
MKKVICLIVLISSLCYSLEYRSIKFNDFLGEISGITGKNIVISGNIDTNFDVFLPTFDLTKVEVITDLLNDILKVNKLSYSVQNNVILIYQATDSQDYILNDYIIKFKNISKDDVISALNLFTENIKYSVYSDRVLLITTQEQYETIKSLINGLDTSYQFRQLSFTIVSTDNNKLKEIGPNIQAILNPLDSFYFKIITNTLTVDSSKINKSSVTTLINLLKENGVSELLYNPRVTLIDSKDSVIESVVKTPIQKSKVEVQNNQTVTTNDIEYQDVGLRLYITNVLITNDSVSFALDLYIENLLDNTNTPRISSRHLKTNVYLTLADSFLIGGINSKETITNIKTIPFIEKIPILGDLTSYEDKQVNDYSFSIFITMLANASEIVFPRYLDNSGNVIVRTGTLAGSKGDPRSGE